MSHTILLVQPTKKPEGRTYSDYESVNECMEGKCNSILYFRVDSATSQETTEISLCQATTCPVLVHDKGFKLFFLTMNVKQGTVNTNFIF